MAHSSLGFLNGMSHHRLADTGGRDAFITMDPHFRGGKLSGHREMCHIGFTPNVHPFAFGTAGREYRQPLTAFAGTKTMLRERQPAQLHPAARRTVDAPPKRILGARDGLASNLQEEMLYRSMRTAAGGALRSVTPNPARRPNSSGARRRHQSRG
mmetsp:Transcript_42226/g.92057  ORF Transcript_42226/g.92057 Transcript_42226/m.92057 type:complete len:155 (+) Transcript_42226:53-517(+)|eukprot:CAMPEP_0204383256 /NCGR_PEP_ID=MMETSP0469-20131031/55850_1 /ASSEMBLY_ACC=CAM_ASM_000384 /TAXON_ID=2969 /ORGANISM="Oxyrrhis marina" /LENGTH=154 /DNA_ID=CAMNT_0051375563 /DNA_START=17 /DNA_END=481 /DNA_ORIENTATION=+